LGSTVAFFCQKTSIFITVHCISFEIVFMYAMHVRLMCALNYYLTCLHRYVSVFPPRKSLFFIVYFFAPG